MQVDRLEQILYDMLGAEDAVVHSEAVSSIFEKKTNVMFARLCTSCMG